MRAQTVERLFQQPAKGRLDKLVIPALLFLILPAIWAVAHLEFVPHEGFEITHPHANSGDEPHYLIMINSILFDRDLELQDDYRRIAAGGLEAGALFRHKFSHHSIIVDKVTGEHAEWTKPAFSWKRADGSFHPALIPMGIHLVPETEVYEAPYHPPAFPALMAALIAPLRPAKSEVEEYVGATMALMGWLGALLTYGLSRRSGLDRWWSLVPVGVLVLASPWLGYSRGFFAEVPIGVALALALLAFGSGKVTLSALSVAAAMFMKPPFILVGVGFGFELAVARKWRPAARMLLVLGFSGLALVLFNYWIARSFLLPPVGLFRREAGVPSYAVEVGGFTGSIPILSIFLYRIFESLVSINFGLLWYAPWALAAFAAIVLERTRSTPPRKIVAAMAFPCLLYFLLLTLLSTNRLNAGYPPGYCYGPRYWISFLPWLAVAFGARMQTLGTRARWGLATLAGFAAIISIAGALRYPQLFRQPFFAALSPHQEAILR